MQVSVALLIVQVLFGLNYAVSKYILASVPPLVWASFRISIAAIVMLLYAQFIWKRPSPGVPGNRRSYFLPLIPFALLGMVINQSAFLLGLRYTTASNSAILNTMIPLFTIGIVVLLGQERMTRSKVIGFLLALCGVLIIQRVESLSFHGMEIVGNFLTILNCLSYAIFLGVSKSFLEKYDRVWTTAWLFVFGAVGIGSLSIPSWIQFDLRGFLENDLSPTLVVSMLFSILAGTLLTYFLNLWALARVKSSEVALYIYFQPFVATLLAWLWFSEVPSLRTLVAAAFIFSGIGVALKGK